MFSFTFTNTLLAVCKKKKKKFNYRRVGRHLSFPAASDLLIFNGSTSLPQHTHVHLPKDIVAGHLNHNCNISNSTILFYPVIFLLYLLELSFL